MLFAVIWAFRLQPHRTGFVFSLYLLLAGFERLLAEKIRVNVKHDVLGIQLTQAEMISLGVITAGFVGVLLTLKTRSSWIKALFAVGVLGALSACVPP
jgi:phosphatidylglycerol:prolipoprotein diacylglycerol transferase